MSRLEQDANDETEARLREQEIGRLIAEIARVREEYRGKVMPLEAVRSVAEMDDDLRRLRRLRQIEATPETVKQQLDNMWRVVLELDYKLMQLTKRQADFEDEMRKWFISDAQDRKRGWWLAAGFRAISLGLMLWAIWLLSALVS